MIPFMANISFYRTPEMVGGVLTNFFGHILPDFGFPDKKLWYYLRDNFPEDNWDRGQVYDLYKWYQTGIESGIAPYDVDTGDRRIFTWMKNNAPYTDSLINHWENAFDYGIRNNFITGNMVGTQLAPAHEGREIAEAGTSFPGAITSGYNALKWGAILAGGLMVLYYSGPVIKKLTKKK